MARILSQMSLSGAGAGGPQHTGCGAAFQDFGQLVGFQQGTGLKRQLLRRKQRVVKACGTA